jgi:acetoin utilization deacetylase AcuC-like enzyme
LAITQSVVNDRLIKYQAKLATKEQLLLAHETDYVEMIFSAAPKEGQMILDADTSMNPHSLDATRLAAGAMCLGIDRIMSGEISRAFCLTRPPGHHAESDRAMGFCIFNAIAVGALYALQQEGINKVAVLDFDVHHGNGTENILANKPGVLFCSTFQSPFYPFSGTGETAHNVINTPLAPNSTPADFRRAISHQWLPALAEFQPDLILVSAGFDAHKLDGISNLQLTEQDYRWVTQQIVTAANAYSDGRVISILEGGYHLQALASSVVVHLEELTS